MESEIIVTDHKSGWRASLKKDIHSFYLIAALLIVAILSRVYVGPAFWEFSHFDENLLAVAIGVFAELAILWILFQKFFEARLRKQQEPFWQIIIKDVKEVRQSAAEYITTTDEFISEVSATSKISDLLSSSAALQKISNRPPQKLLQSVKSANLSIDLYSGAIPENHATDIVKAGVQTNEFLRNYQNLIVPNLHLAEKAFYTTQLAMNVYNLFLATDELIKNVQVEGLEAKLSDSDEIEHARNACLEGLKKTETVLVGFGEKLRQTFFSKSE